MKSDEIKEEQKVHLHKMDGEYVLRLRCGNLRENKITVWKAFITIKEVLKLEKTLSDNLFNSTVLPVIFIACKTWATIKKEEQCLVMTQRAIEKSKFGIFLDEMEQSGGKDMIMETQKKFLLDWIHCKVTDNR